MANIPKSYVVPDRLHQFVVFVILGEAINPEEIISTAVHFILVPLRHASAKVCMNQSKLILCLFVWIFAYLDSIVSEAGYEHGNVQTLVQ